MRRLRQRWRETFWGWGYVGGVGIHVFFIGYWNVRWTKVYDGRLGVSFGWNVDCSRTERHG